ncbi:MAG: DNA internalization-related competence protein ComEC/Rec2 [Peptostreptococcaceae bacterium]|nr:DNA internalization-related competence protein ComEC/Rec2 [Peptostreptococcaceae bacterium]
MRRPLALFLVSYFIGMMVLFDSPFMFIGGICLWIVAILFIFEWSEETLKRLVIVFFGVVIGMGLTFYSSDYMQTQTFEEGNVEVYGYAYGPEYGNAGKLVLKVKKIKGKEGYSTANAKILILSDKDISKYRHTYIKYSGVLINESKPKNPNAFNYSKYGLIKGYDKVSFFDGKAAIVEIEAKKYFDPVIIKDKILIKSERILEKNSQAYFASLVFGDTSLLGEEKTMQIGMSGLSHLFAVSGLHIAVLFGFLTALSNLFYRKSHWIKSIVILSTVFLFVSIIGFPVSAIRAFVFISIYSLAGIARRKYDLLNVLLLSAAIILLWNPYQLFSAGFQLSFGAVASIYFIYPALSEWIHPKNIAVKALMISLSVQVGIAPVLIYHFNYLSIISIIANVPAVLLFGTWLPILYIFAIANILSIPLLPQVLAFPVEWGTNALDWLSKAASGFSWSYIELPFVGYKFIGLYYCVCTLFVLQSRKDYFLRVDKMKKTVAAILVAIAVATIPAIANVDNQIEIIFFDVGQGDCVFVRTANGRNILIDSGTEDIDISEILMRNGIKRIDLAILTHFHEDHYGGLFELAEKGRIDTLLMKETLYENGDVKQALETKMRYAEKTVIYTKSGQSLEIDGLSMQILNVGKNYEGLSSHSAENNDSIVVLLDYRDFEMLLVGDIEEKAEKSLSLENPVDIDLIKASHHGSKTSNIDSFLEAYKPEVVVVQVGKNIFGHPAPSVIERYESFDMDVYRTDKDGAVIIKTNGLREFIVESNFSNRSESYGLE